MKERPILFNGNMVRAILDGRKTQTRRTVKYIPSLGMPGSWNIDHDQAIVGDYRRFCPFGNVGDFLWVRETTEADEESCDSVVLSRYSADKSPVLYQACKDEEFNGSVAHWWCNRKSCPSIHMPRWASRITLEITDVRVERLSSIRESDAKAEGFDGSTIVPGHDGLECRAWFEGLWDSVYGDNSFRSNPWVWVVEFKVVKS